MQTQILRKEQEAMNHFYLIVLFSLLLNPLYAEDVASLAKELNLYGGTKAKIQWERVFSSERHLLRYGLEKLPPETRQELKAYLIKHAADSKQPIVPGL